MSSKRLNTEAPNDQLGDLLKELRSQVIGLSDDDKLPTGFSTFYGRGFKRGESVIIGFGRGRQIDHSWIERAAQQPRSKQYFDPAADYTERTGRYLSLSERMQERSRYDQQHDDDF